MDLTSLSEPSLAVEVREQINAARRCFESLDKTTSLSLSYPKGHPIIVSASESTKRQFDAYFETNDRLTVLLQSHSFELAGTKTTVWSTYEPRDYVWMMSRDGIIFLHILAGITSDEIRKFISTLNSFIDERNIEQDAASILFEKNFRYISFDAIDESMAVLANVEFDIRDRDTKEEREMVEDLFDQAFDSDEKMQSDQPPREHDNEFRIRMQKRSEYQQRVVMGSRQFLELSDASQLHLLALKRGFSEHAELEYREGEMLAAILGAHPKEKLRTSTVTQIGELVSTLLESAEPWAVLELLKIIHEWRENFPKATSQYLKNEVIKRFDKAHLDALLDIIATGDDNARRLILRMFHSLNLEEAIGPLTGMLAWKLKPAIHDDIMRYVQERSKQDINFLRDVVLKANDEEIEPYLVVLRSRLPESKPILLELLKKNKDFSIQLSVLESLVGTWEVYEVEPILVPLFSSENSKIRRSALMSIAEKVPDLIPNILPPVFDKTFLKRPRDEQREIASICLQYGGPTSIVKIKAFIQLRGRMFPENEVNLALDLATIMARSSTPQIIEMLTTIGADWRVPQKIRSTCKELAELVTKNE